jgi:Na+(H+)/acetate symporter ActP
VVAQIYGVGLIASRFTGVDFSVGIFLGLASILVCSFLGGMRAVTWTQVAQYIIILVAFLIPVMWLSVKHTTTRCRRWRTARPAQAGRARAQLAPIRRKAGARDVPPARRRLRAASCGAAGVVGSRPRRNRSAIWTR